MATTDTGPGTTGPIARIGQPAAEEIAPPVAAEQDPAPVERVPEPVHGASAAPTAAPVAAEQDPAPTQGVHGAVAAPEVQAPAPPEPAVAGRRRPPRPTREAVAAGPFDPITTLARSWLLLAVCLVLGAAVLGVAVHMRPVAYTSTAKVVWQSDMSQYLPPALVGGAGAADAGRSLSTQADVVTGDTVMQAAATATGVKVQDLRDRTTVKVVQTSDVMTVEVAAPTASKAQAQAQALVTTYLAGSKQQGVTALTARADALQPPIDALQGQLDALNAIVPPVAITASQIAIANAQTAATAASRNSVIGQLSDLRTQQNQLRAAAAVYPGQASLLSAADQPLKPSSISLRVALLVGAALGLVFGALVALVRGARRASRAARTGA